MGGTNAHAILQGIEIAPHTHPTASAAHRGHWFLPVSARSEQALRELAGRYHRFLVENPSIDLGDICWSATTRRTHHHFRLAVVGKDRAALLDRLALFAEGKGAHLSNGRLSQGQEPEKPVFVFTGMGPQWWAMGRELLANEPAYREIAERCDAIFQEIAGCSILEEMGRDEQDSRITRTHIAQPANFVLQVALVDLWQSKGITPSAIVGHSVGEVSAAYASGALSLEDALAVSYHRSRLQRTVAGQGRMLAMGLSEEEAEALLGKYGRGKISFGAINSPASLTLSGDGETLEKVAEELETREVFNRFLQVELAYHSPIMDGLRDGMSSALADLEPQAPSIPLYSTVTGERIDTQMHDASYWCNNIRQPVRFAKAIQSMVKAGHGFFLEVGPHPVLGGSIEENVSAVRGKARVVSSLKRDEPEIDTFYRALGELYTQGCPPDWSALYPDGGRFVRLPLYPWQRQTYWRESEESRFDRLGSRADHPLLGHRTNAPEMAWEQPVNGQFLPWLSDHRIQDLVILPGAAYVEIGLALLDRIAEGQVAGGVEDLHFEHALVVTSGNEPILRTRYDPKRRIFTIYSRNVGGHAWTLHARGHLSLVASSKTKPLNISRLRRHCPKSIEVSILYKRLSQRGMQYGEAFRGIREIRRGHDEVLARIVTDPEGDLLSMENPSPKDDEQAKPVWRLHPTRLDAAFQSLLGILDAGDDRSFIPVSIGRLGFHGRPGPECWAHGRLTRREGRDISADIDIFDDDGVIWVEIRDLRLRELENMGGRAKEAKDLMDWIHRVDWEELPPLTERRFAGRWLLFMDRGGRMESLAERLEAEGIAITRAFSGEAFAEIEEGRFTLRGQYPDDMRALADSIELTQYQGVVYGWGMDCDESQDPDGSQSVIDGIHCSHIVYDAHNEGNNQIRFFLLTQGAQSPGQSLGDSVSDAPVNVAQASLIGLGRTIAAEHYYYTRCCLIDLPIDVGPVMDALVAELLCDGIEIEIALRGAGQRLGYRIRRCALEDLQGPDNPADSQPLMLNGRDAFALERQPDREGGSSWQWRQAAREPAKRGEATIHVERAIIPAGGLRQHGKTLIAVSGRRMAGGAPGPAVMGFLSIEQLASHVSLPAGEFIEAQAQAGASAGGARFRHAMNRLRRFLTRRRQTTAIPDVVQRAASLLPFVGAMHALERAAALTRGERVLIHPSDDGVDLAATQVALTLGAEVFATYADETKRDALRALGANHVLPMAGFVDAVLALTHGKGVQVVLNTLDGEPAQKSLLLLTPFDLPGLSRPGRKRPRAGDIPALGTPHLSDRRSRQGPGSRP
uniref:Zinc-binding dehydrogenase n=1 Tax=Candidatus Kentrum sp. TC TaxID=2126339 RepID=A0A450Y8I5_9GAMM|nr:MAG: Zinc-binding dehydrogenase [Candidatus Kentron sp. TC]